MTGAFQGTEVQFTLCFAIPIPIRESVFLSILGEFRNPNAHEIAFLVIPDTQLFVLFQFGQFQFAPDVSRGARLGNHIPMYKKSHFF